MARMKARYGVEAIRDAARLAARTLRDKVRLMVRQHKNLENVACDEFGRSEANDLESRMFMAGSGHDDGETVEEIAASIKSMIEEHGGTEVSIDFVRGGSSDDDIIDAVSIEDIVDAKPGGREES